MQGGTVKANEKKFETYKNDKLHSFFNQPALITKHVKVWYKNGKVHNDSRDENGYLLPTMIWANGDKFWYKNGKLHNDDRDENGCLLPAEIFTNGDKYWWQNGKRHNDSRDENGYLLPAITAPNGSKSWWQNGKHHNDDRDENGNLLPAQIHNNVKEYWFNGEEIKNPTDYKNKTITKTSKTLENDINEKFQTLTADQKKLIMGVINSF